MSEANNNDELISQFMAFTGTSDADKATSYLEMSGNDVETAVGLFLEHEPNTTTSSGTSRERSGGNHDDFGVDEGMDRPRRGRGRASGSNRSSNAMMDEDGVRAPDQTRTMRLMDDDSQRMMGLPPNIASMMMMGHNPTFDLMTAMMDEHDTMMIQEQQQQAVPPAFASSAAALTSLNARALLDAAIARQGQGGGNDSSTRMEEKENHEDHDGDDYDYDDEDEDEDDHQRDHRPPEPPRLSDMFAAPAHLMHRAGGFQGARTMAKDSKRWLLVNLQRDAEFASHALNRDVWRDELVENLIREGFIFWQQVDTTTEGRTFAERYQVHEYPHISIIDPRTGRLMWRKEGWTQQNAFTADAFAEIAMDFCSRNSFDRPPQAPRPPVNVSTMAATSSTPAKRMHEMSEEEQLQAAMQASMTDAGVAASSTNTDIVYVDDSYDDNDDAAVQILEDTKPKATQDAEMPSVSLNDELQAYTLPEEPTTTDDVSRIQFRTVDGKRVVRKFSSSDPVRAIYAFIAQTTEEARTTGREFVLMAGYPPIDLLGDIDRTIGDVKLNGQVITVRWK